MMNEMQFVALTGLNLVEADAGYVLNEPRQKDLKKHFVPYWKILNVRIRKNFAFIQFASQDEATKALEATNMSQLMDRVITVEYAMKEDDERRNGYSPERIRDRSPRRGNDRVRSPIPYARERGSPDYGHGRGHGCSPYTRERANPDYARGPSWSSSRKGWDHEFSRGRSPSPRKEKDSKLSPSPRKERVVKHSPSPKRERSPDNIINGSGAGKKVSPDYGHSPGLSPEREPGERVESPADYGRERSPAYSDGESSPHERYASQSPPA